MSDFGRPHPQATHFQLRRRIGTKASKDGREIGRYETVQLAPPDGGVAERTWEIGEHDTWDDRAYAFMLGLPRGKYRFAWRGADGAELRGDGPEFVWSPPLRDDGSAAEPPPPPPPAIPDGLALNDYIEAKASARAEREVRLREQFFSSQLQWMQEQRAAEREREKAEREEERERRRDEREADRERHRQDLERMSALMGAARAEDPELAELRAAVDELAGTVTEMIEHDARPTSPPRERTVTERVLDVVEEPAKKVGQAGAKLVDQWVTGPNGAKRPDAE